VIQHPVANNKPALDEESFTRLLAAAYVMQEHQDRVRTKVSPADLTEIIAQVVDTQHEIQTHSYQGTTAFALIANRLCSVTGASGVAIGTVDANKLRYNAAVGTASSLSGTEIDKHDSLASSCLKTGTSFQSPLAQTDPRLNSARCRKLGAQSLLAVPLYHDGRVEGAIELYFSQISGFGDSEIRAAELMAGVASEVIADASEQELREELESERASVLQALEVLEPELQKIAGAAVETATPAAAADPQPELCRACGHAFVGNETSCGVCGASRTTGMYPGAALQSKWAVLWERHLTGSEQNGMPLFRKTRPQETTLPVARLPEDLARELNLLGKQSGQRVEEEDVIEDAADSEEQFSSAAEADSEQSLAITGWHSSAPLAELPVLDQPEGLEATALVPQAGSLRQRPGDICLAVASVVLAITLLWALWPRNETTSWANAKPPSMSVVKRRPHPKPPKLSLFEEALVGLGLAVPPPAPEYMGDPNVKVWEDLETALYYCPDTDLYGNTAKGRFTTQAEAQQDAFEPALRKPCD
jgi:hypothetical protein